MSELEQQLMTFAEHIRSPALDNSLGVADDRLNIYRKLFYNNIHSFLSRGFPVLQQILSDTHWHALIHDFFQHHRISSPLFQDIPQAFVLFLQQQDHNLLAELAHYEWAELAVEIAIAEVETQRPCSDETILKQILQLSPLAYPLHYHYPVHRISSNYIPTATEETFLLVYRDNHDVVNFQQINIVNARLLQLIDDAGALTGEQILQQIASELPQHNQVNIFANGIVTLQQFHQQGIILLGENDG